MKYNEVYKSAKTLSQNWDTERLQNQKTRHKGIKL